MYSKAELDEYESCNGLADTSDVKLSFYLVAVHQLEALLVHGDLLLAEAFILTPEKFSDDLLPLH